MDDAIGSDCGGTGRPLAIYPEGHSCGRQRPADRRGGYGGRPPITFDCDPRFVAAAAGSIAGFSLLVAVIEIYGLLAYTVARGTPEFGIRFALGASSAQITWIVLRGTLLRLLTGLSVGLAFAWWLARLIEGQLFAVQPHDPAIFAGVAVCLLMSASLAVIAPVRRAMSVDPSVALRAE